MKLSDLISMVHDECGDARREMIGANRVALSVINQLDLYSVKMAASQKGSYSTLSFTPTMQTGNIALTFVPEIVRTRRLPENSVYANWEIIDVVSDIEAISNDETHGRLSILFLNNFTQYQLSWKPLAGNAEVLEIWGKAASQNRPGLTDTVTAIPIEFHQLIAVRSALEVLDDLLLPRMDGMNYVPFVTARKGSLDAKARELEHFFNVFRTTSPDFKSINRAAPYNPLIGMDSSFDTDSY